MFTSKNAAFSSPCVRYGATGGGSFANTTTLTYTHTPKANDNCVVVGASSYSFAGAPTGAPTYGGTAMVATGVALNIESSDYYMYLWYLRITPGAGAKTVSVPTSSGFNASNSLSYSGVSSVIGGVTSQSTTASVSITPAAGKPGGLTVAIAAGLSSSALALSAPITTRWSQPFSTNVNEPVVLGDAPSTNASLTATLGASADMAIGYLQLAS
jgi:hypothetical protein